LPSSSAATAWTEKSNERCHVCEISDGVRDTDGLAGVSGGDDRIGLDEAVGDADAPGRDGAPRSPVPPHPAAANATATSASVR
jgi:hypothetical protein